MQKLVGAYEDEHFQKDYVDKNTKAIEKQLKCLVIMGTITKIKP